MEWLSDRHGGNLGADLLGEKDALLDGLGGEFRPVSRDQDVLVQDSSPPVCVSLCQEDQRKSISFQSVRFPSMTEATIGINVPTDIRRIPALAKAIVRFLDIHGNKPA